MDNKKIELLKENFGKYVIQFAGKEEFEISEFEEKFNKQVDLMARLFTALCTLSKEPKKTQEGIELLIGLSNEMTISKLITVLSSEDWSVVDE